jgi:hypothetical protein
VEARLLVKCAECDRRYYVSARNAREWRRRGREPVCAECRRRPVRANAKQMAKLRAWWLERFTWDELVELGRDL